MLGLELVTSKRPEPYFGKRRFYLSPTTKLDFAPRKFKN